VAEGSRTDFEPSDQVDAGKGGQGAHFRSEGGGEGPLPGGGGGGQGPCFRSEGGGEGPGFCRLTGSCRRLTCWHRP
jgi:hypothetical protein